jgi:dTDP-4-dehydrorhamnose reductase
MLRLAAQGKPIRVVNDQRCTPTFTVDLARVVSRMVRQRSRGLYHVTNSGDCTWYELAVEVFQQMSLSVDIGPITSFEYGAVARRPQYSVLSMEKLLREGMEAVPEWKDALARYLVARQSP